MLYNYLIIRYKVFVIELGRSALKELSKLDVYCKHYVLLLDNVVIGTSRLCYTDNVVELGRVALLADYRNKGYASLAISFLINQIKEEGKRVIYFDTHFHRIIEDIPSNFGRKFINDTTKYEIKDYYHSLFFWDQNYK